ncbi:MAG: hypothetical protein NXI11_00870 [Proteobacteria bacterium]|nr:hypothetical protein [Pseudomonadota bacterium]
MTTVRRKGYSERFGAGVSVSDWTATASCPQCGKQHVRYRMSPERDGFYMVTAEVSRDAADYIAIVRTFALAKATVIQAAMIAAVSCDRCFDASLRPVDKSLGAHSNTGFLSHIETNRHAGTPPKGVEA